MPSVSNAKTVVLHLQRKDSKFDSPSSSIPLLLFMFRDIISSENKNRNRWRQINDIKLWSPCIWLLLRPLLTVSLRKEHSMEERYSSHVFLSWNRCRALQCRRCSIADSVLVPRSTCVSVLVRYAPASVCTRLLSFNTGVWRYSSDT